MIDEAKLKEFQDIYGTLKADAIGEFRPQLENHRELDDNTGEAIICHTDGDVAAYVSGNLGLGFDCQTMAAYIVAACNLAPDLARELAELHAALALTAAERDRAEEMSQRVRQANVELRAELETMRMERDYRVRVDEWERLTAELAAMTAQRDELLEEKEQDEKITRMVMEERCSPDEHHCTCVPILRAEVAALREANRWISVEVPPQVKEGEWFMVRMAANVSGFFTDIAWYIPSYNGGRWFVHREDVTDRIVCYRPLPQPPEASE